MANVHMRGLLWSVPARSARVAARKSEPALEVMVLWNGDVLSVRHLAAPFRFSVGDGSVPCDLVVPEEVARGPAYELISQVAGETFVHAESAESTRLELERPATVQLGELELRFRLTASEAHGFGAASFEREPFGYFGASLAVVASLVTSFAMFTPRLGLTDGEELDRDRVATMLQYLHAQAEREQPPTPGEREQSSGERSAPSEGSKGESGALGKRDETATNRKFASNAPSAARDTTMSRSELLADAADFGMIGILASAAPMHPGALFENDGALNQLDLNKFGNMFGQDIGDAAGVGGLGPLGPGEGSGGPGVGIGMRGIGTCQTLGGCNGGDGIANSGGLLQRGHTTTTPRIRTASVDVSGRLPSEVIQRVVRQNFGRFRVCYESGLRTNPTLNGRVSARFVIDRTGAVSAVQNGGSDIPDSGVVNCVMSAFYGLSFPAPDNGVVRVTYPIMFSVG